MNILLITDSFYPEISGISTVAESITELLIERDHKVTVCTNRYKKTLNLPNVNYVQMNLYSKPLWLPTYAVSLLKLNYNMYDQIIINGTSAVIVAGLVLGKNILSKSIVLVHGFEVEWVYESSTLASKLLPYKLMHKTKFISRSKLFYLKDKIKVSHTGIDFNIFHSDKNIEVQKRLKELAKDRDILISVSRIVEKKGYLNMLNAFRKIVDRNNNLVWIIVGNGPYKKVLDEKIKEYGLQDNIYMLGAIERYDLRYYYSCANCFWLLSDYDENLPLVYLEAQACGIPAIGWNKGGVVETISSESGFLVNTIEECVDIISDKRYCNKKSNDILKFAFTFQKDSFIKAFL